MAFLSPPPVVSRQTAVTLGGRAATRASPRHARTALGAAASAVHGMRVAAPRLLPAPCKAHPIHPSSLPTFFCTAAAPPPPASPPLEPTRLTDVVPTAADLAAMPSVAATAARTYSFRGWRIEYLAAGDDAPDAADRPAIVCVHGFGANCRQWRRNVPALAAAGYRTYAVDLLGFGLSDKPPPGTADAVGKAAAYSFPYWSAQLRGFLTDVVLPAGRGVPPIPAPAANGTCGDDADAPPPAPVLLVANSIGAIACMQALVDEPGCAAGLVAISPSLRMLHVRKRGFLADVFAPLAMRALAVGPVGAAFLAYVAEPAALRRVLSQAYAVGAAIDDELVRLLLEPAESPGALAVFLAFTSYDTGPLAEDLLPQLGVPTRLVWGERDSFEPYRLCAPLAEYDTVRAGGGLVVLEGVGHCAHDEAPAAVNEVVTAFAQRVLGGRTEGVLAPEDAPPVSPSLP